MLVGAHAPNGPITSADIGIIKLGEFKSAKVLWYHSAEDIQRLREAGVQHFTVRLQDSIWYSNTGEYIPSFWDYGDAVAERINHFYRLGIKDAQLDNEPNITWVMHAMGPWQYRDWLRHVIGYLRDNNRIPKDVRLGFPPMSFADKFLPYQWLGPMIDTAPLFDFLCVNSYWQSNRQGRTNILAGPMLWRQFGANAQWYRDWQRNMTVQVVEWGNSIHEQGVYSPAEVDRFRAEQYPLWLEWARAEGYIEAAHVYLVGGTPDWRGFAVTPLVARALARPSD